MNGVGEHCAQPVTSAAFFPGPSYLSPSARPASGRCPPGAAGGEETPHCDLPPPPSSGNRDLRSPALRCLYNSCTGFRGYAASACRLCRAVIPFCETAPVRGGRSVTGANRCCWGVSTGSNLGHQVLSSGGMSFSPYKTYGRQASGIRC